ncbi:ABC transporter permease [Rhodohalobacter sulfatireducens]|uniref:ABC transporter permease n=1 Tax=Rhodohalobacter sulfatireducens TaxID=2911366 RepID=A0ABS9K9E5_9BACT|nr:ABC transporter permease [Rhodohalobacter sulfatireducens]MCG2587485.1 ABC transporter permease [Rhodohalobacter sulfatireducens]
MLKKLIYNFDIALEAIKQNTMRSFLTSLGIIFGVASVIAMLAIGRGAQQEVLQQMQLLGTNNVIVEPVVRQVEGEVQQVDGVAQEENRYSPGLTLEDMQSIVQNISNIESVSPEIVFDTEFIRNGRLRSGKLIGVSQEYFDINSFTFAAGGTFSDIQVRDSEPVCIIGSDIENRFFAGEKALGQKIKAGDIWFTVVGVLEKREISTENIENLGIRNYNLDIYTPATTVLLRYKNRGMLTGQDIQSAAANNGAENTTTIGQNYHQLDKLIVRVSDNRYSVPISDIIRRMLTRRHNGVIDFEVIVPELLLQQERRTQSIFNIVLSSIASISLIVGGIGIMNIMLASVVERIREIGVRRAVGALKQDIKFQFLTEALAISITGGIIGIILGIAFSYLIEITAGIQTIVTILSIFISFGVAMSIGVIFGYFPAKRAAEQDPVKSLHHE